ncbi:IPT/TIG domain-containing protein [Legionella micdadei]|uniref:IPT/TIG domain-containing protein n=1 Tax=Legionella micdadei TaxID=451 RepID=UPI0020A5ACFE|nr:IPT/TIG domain-containing protein [Legionella micdadei]
MKKKSNKCLLGFRMLAFLWSGLITTTVCAGIPLWTFEPLTPTSLAVPANSTALVQYRVTNQSSSPHTLLMLPIQGIMQINTGLGDCSIPFMLLGKGACTLSLQVIGSQIIGPIIDGPVVCQLGSLNPCYRPSPLHVLNITQAPPITNAVIAVKGSPLTLTVDGSIGQLTIYNTSTEVAATNITSNFIGTALNGNVTETGNSCSYVPPGGSCTITYTPGHTVVPQTNFNIKGTNTNAVMAAIAIESGITLTAINPNSGTASGGTGFTLTGTGLTGATSITFDGIAATSVKVVNSTTVTGVTPAHTAGFVDVVISTPTGSATLANGYQYLTTAVGQPSGGGTIACLSTGNNLIAAIADNSAGIQWGGSGTATGATSTTNGATNTAQIVTVLTALGVPTNTYAASLCSNYEVDSQGNTPCQVGNTCYNDWFLPAGDNLTASGQLNCLFTNRAVIGGFASDFYWSSTEDSASLAWRQDFNNGNQSSSGKNLTFHVRCVRAFTP